MRSRFEWSRWRSRVVLAIVVLTLLILAAVSVFSFQAYQRNAATLAIENDRQITYVSAARLRDELTRFTRELDSLVRSPQIYRGQTVQQEIALQEARHRLTIFDGGVVLLDNFGQVRATQPARPEIDGEDWSDRPFFRELLGTSQEFYSDVTLDGPDGAPVALISVPIIGERGEFVGALAGMFRLGESQISSLYASIVRLRLTENGNIYVVDRGGRILYDSDFARIGETLDLPAGAATDIQGVALRTSDLDGNDVIAAYAPIPGTGWTLISEDEWTSATRATQSYARTLVVLLALGTVLPALGVALLIRTKNSEIIERERDVHEQRLAWLIQERLLPRAVPMLPGWNLDVFHKPLPASGGDFYDFFLLPDGMLALTLGHVHAKGLDAVHLIDTVRSALRGAAQLRLPAGEALAYGNKLVCPELYDESCVSALYALLDPTTGTLTYASAGALPPWTCAVSADGTLQAEGASLGMNMASEFPQNALQIQVGECLTLLSAGIFQAHRPDGEAFDLETLHAIVSVEGRDAEGVAEALATQLKSFTGVKGLPPEDITVIIVQRRSETSWSESAGQPGRQVSEASDSAVG